MIDIEVNVSQDPIERMRAILYGVPGSAEKVIRDTINSALSEGRNAATQQIHEVYAISRPDLRARSKIKTKKASASDPIGYISFAGTAIPLYRFNVSPKQPGTGKTVKATELRSSAQTPFERAFIAQMDNPHTGMFEREGKERLPIREFYGPSIARMAENSIITQKAKQVLEKSIEENLYAKIMRILEGYWR